MIHRFGRTLWVSVVQITVLCAVSLSSHAKAMQNQEAVHLFTCAIKDSARMMNEVKILEEEGHLRMKSGTARSDREYVSDGVCIKKVVLVIAQGRMIVFSQVCSDTDSFQRYLEHHFSEQSSEAELRAERAFFMRKRGNGFAALSKENPSSETVSLACAVDLR